LFYGTEPNVEAM